jgi:hypothetical protein
VQLGPLVEHLSVGKLALVVLPQAVDLLSLGQLVPVVPLVPLEKLQELPVELLLELLRVLLVKPGQWLPAEQQALLAPSLQHQAQ